LTGHGDGFGRFVRLARQLKAERGSCHLNCSPIQTGLACAQSQDRENNRSGVLQKKFAHCLIINASM
jgi:hypothetical protein